MMRLLNIIWSVNYNTNELHLFLTITINELQLCDTYSWTSTTMPWRLDINLFNYSKLSRAEACLCASSAWMLCASVYHWSMTNNENTIFQHYKPQKALMTFQKLVS